MVELKIAELAQSKGVNSSYELQNRLDVTARTAVRLWRGNMNSITLPMIALLCEKLDCSPADFIIYTPEKKSRKRR